jgi:branched-chain amino acid transport system substrate-binding protein
MRDCRLYLALVLSCTAWGPVRAEISDNVVRIGVLNDISGIFQDTNGMGSVVAARMSAEDFNGGGKNIKVEIVYADHQNKTDVGSAIVRKWLDVDGVDAVVDVPNSAVGLTISSLLRDSRMTFLASSTASSDLTGKGCSPCSIRLPMENLRKEWLRDRKLPAYQPAIASTNGKLVTKMVA